VRVGARGQRIIKSRETQTQTPQNPAPPRNGLGLVIDPRGGQWDPPVTAVVAASRCPRCRQCVSGFGVAGLVRDGSLLVRRSCGWGCSLPPRSAPTSPVHWALLPAWAWEGSPLLDACWHNVVPPLPSLSVPRHGLRSVHVVSPMLSEWWAWRGRSRETLARLPPLLPCSAPLPVRGAAAGGRPNTSLRMVRSP
jgi:hypothetical protein